MALKAGTRLGPYEIQSTIGAGSMGVVYRARDTRLGREVAIKVLPPAFARDPDRLGRFEREARAVAAINHPNILSVHDIGTAGVTDTEQGSVQAAYMVTELLDGETLRARLGTGPLAPRKAADVAMQVARGLSAAHDRGIVHRDLKPENIVLLRDGHVKILDFGLAKQAATASGEQETVAGTDAGTVLGTVEYMAPEQVRGEPADARTDLFALGAVLYELASGQRPFSRPTAAETMTAILRDDPPDLAVTSSGLTHPLWRVIRHALEKDSNDRFQSARDFAFALQASGDTSSSGAAAAATHAHVKRPVRGREIAAWALAGMLAVASCVALWPRSSGSPATTPMIFSPALPWRDPVLVSPSISPDGTRIAFVLLDGGGSIAPAPTNSIVVRRVNTVDLLPLKGTGGARIGSVFWSPDGKSLGFFAAGKLKRIDLASAEVEEIADAPAGYGGAWSPDGTILFSPDERSPIFRVHALGGQPVQVTTLDPARGDQAHRWPSMLPDGRHFVFTPWSADSTKQRAHLGSLDGGDTRPLFETLGSAPIVAGGYYVFVRDVPSTLLAQAFDSKTFEPVGRAMPIVADTNVDFVWFTGAPLASASATTLVYTTEKFRLNRLTWFDRFGRPLETLGATDSYFDPELSDDGSMIAVEKRDADRGASDLWTADLARGAFTRLTSAARFESVATWSPDGRRVAFGSDQGKAPSILVKNASGGDEQVLVNGRAFPTDWSPDGAHLLYMSDGGATRMDVWVYDIKARTSRVLLNSPFAEMGARFSPDGKWIAYASDEGRETQVFVQSFPDGAGRRVQASISGGMQPVWRQDGRELFFVAPGGMLMAADVRHNGSSLTVGTAQPLFATGAEPNRVLRNHYAPSRDGQKFLVAWPSVPPSNSRLVGVLNWTAGLQK